MNIHTPPSEYRKAMTLELKSSSKSARSINALGALAVIPLLILGFIISPIGAALETFDPDKAWMLLLLPLFIIVGVAVYTLLREGIHGLLIRYITNASPTFGFYGILLYACNDKSYINKKTYILISLTPSALLFIALLILNIALPALWFWPIYFIQIVNIAGAFGDLYIAYLAYKMPDDLLVRDRGVDISFYTKQDVSSKLPNLDIIFDRGKAFKKKVFHKLLRLLHKFFQKIRSKFDKKQP